MGTKIRKGQPLGKVGMTGITTTPHLHFQIDKASAPFHVYWPYSYSDLNELGIDFFAAVNMGLGKENALKNTVHPMTFVQENATEGASQVAATSSTVAVASASEAAKPAEVDPASEAAPKNSAPAETPKPEPVLPVEEPKDDSKNILETAPVAKPVEAPVIKPVETLSVVETPVAVVKPVVPAVKKQFSDVPKNVAYRASFDRLLAA